MSRRTDGRLIDYYNKFTHRRESIIDRLVIYFGSFFAHLLVRSLRIQVVDTEHYDALEKAQQRVIFLLWHRTLLLVAGRGEQFGVVSLVSPSRDGDIAAAFSTRVGIPTVRGDSRKKSAPALLKLRRALTQGNSIALFPDGPLGPSGEVKPGALALARLTQRPIIPVGADARWKIVFTRSWDKFLLPLPFSKVCLAFGKPVWIDKNSLSTNAEQAAALAEQINRLTTQARLRLNLAGRDPRLEKPC